jgi:hypothetical protein
MAEIWDGKSWTIEPMNGPVGASDVTLSKVSCSARDECTAVGSFRSFNGVEWDNLPLVERWDGSSWNQQTAPGPDGDLSDVSCAAADACTAVGSYFDQTEHPLIDEWDGSAWTMQKVPRVGQLSGLSAVSCTSRDSCTAVGTVQSSDFAENQPVVLAEK